jgi:hypothetical protein
VWLAAHGYRGRVHRVSQRDRAPTPVGRILDYFRFDPNPPHRQPAPLRLLLATVVSVIGSLAAGAVLVAIGKAVFPTTRDFPTSSFRTTAS